MKSCSYRHRGAACLSTVMLALLAACGGGGGDESPSGAAAAPASNGSPTPPPAVDPAPQPPPAALFTEAEVTREVAVTYAREMLNDLKRGHRTGKNTVLVFSDVRDMLAAGSVSGPCSSTATGTVAVTVVNPSADATLNATDSVNRYFSACNFSTSLNYLSGSIFNYVRAFSGSMANGSSWSGSLNDSYTSFISQTLGDRGATYTNGAIDRTATVDGATQARTTSVHYRNYTSRTFSSSATNATPASFEYMYADYLQKHASDSTGGTIAIDGSYTYSEPVKPSYRPTEWKYTTETPFRFDLVNGQDASQPSAGKVRMALSMTPINGSRLGTTWELVFVDANTARLNVDLDNNGTTDLSHDLTWAELQ
jgi:hypothetical protein